MKRELSINSIINDFMIVFKKLSMTKEERKKQSLRHIVEIRNKKANAQNSFLSEDKKQQIRELVENKNNKNQLSIANSVAIDRNKIFSGIRHSSDIKSTRKITIKIGELKGDPDDIKDYLRKITNGRVITGFSFREFRGDEEDFKEVMEIIREHSK